MAGHRAAARQAPLYGIAVIAISVALFTLALHGRLMVVVIICGIGGIFAIVTLSISTAVRASRAARAADNGTDHSRVDYSNLPRPDILPPRVATAASWTFAVIAWAAMVLALIGICYGYARSIHHQLPPNGTFGFRDPTAFWCLSGWYCGPESRLQLAAVRVRPDPGLHHLDLPGRSDQRPPAARPRRLVNADAPPGGFRSGDRRHTRRHRGARRQLLSAVPHCAHRLA